MALKMVDVASCMFRQKCRASAAFTAECLMTNKTAWGYTSAQIRHGMVWDQTIHFFRHLHYYASTMFFCGMNIVFLAKVSKGVLGKKNSEGSSKQKKIQIQMKGTK